MKTKILLIRHGQSEGNLINVFLGQTDLPLTELGHTQAEHTADHLKNIDIDAIYSSDLIRAYETAGHTASKKGLPITKVKKLREIYVGEWEFARFDDLVKRFPETYGKIWMHDIGNAVADGGESVRELRDRVLEAVKKIGDENPGKTVALFTHATPIRVLFAEITGGLDVMKDLKWATNASVSEVSYEDGKLTAVRYSDDSFMGDLLTDLPNNC